ncbi:MAG: hypothetical protein ACK5KR_05780 [Breznakia sp.]
MKKLIIILVILSVVVSNENEFSFDTTSKRINEHAEITDLELINKDFCSFSIQLDTASFKVQVAKGKNSYRILDIFYYNPEKLISYRANTDDDDGDEEKEMKKSLDTLEITLNELEQFSKEYCIKQFENN